MTVKKLSPQEINSIKAHYAKRWLDPVKRIEDIFNVRRADGSLTKLRVPNPQKVMIQDGILGKSRELVGTGVSYIGVTNKGRQLGFSVILAAESILICEDFPGTKLFYVATAKDQAEDWMDKFTQLCQDANQWPPELGGGPIINITNVEKTFTKTINRTVVAGLSANPPAIRGKTGIHVIFDEAAWAIRFKNQAKETWKALKYIIRQGGSARIQSTPRTSDIEEFFWGMYSKGESGTLAIHQYYCPVIENWKDLDLEDPLFIHLDNKTRKLRGMNQLTQKDYNNLIERYSKRTSFEIIPGKCIKQKAIVPYWWVSLEDLETDRAEDIEQFKQENLGIPLDETYKLIKSEWIYTNLNEGDEIDARPGQNENRFFILIDLAQKNDITAITVVEEVVAPEQTRPIYVERKIIETQAEYTVQRDIIFELYINFRATIISIDNTGHGIVIGDMMEEKLRDNGFNPKILKRVTFTLQSKEQMAIGFRNIVMPDPITRKSRYRWLYKVKKHENAIRHCMRVEKELLPQGGTRYSGKMHGRDDHFWSKAQLALIEIPTGVPRAAFRKRKQTTPLDYMQKESMSFGRRFLNNQNRLRMEVKTEDREAKEQLNRDRFEKIRHLKNINFAIKCLSNGVVICRYQGKPVKPIHCASEDNCKDPKCPGYKYVNEICLRYGVTKDEIWKRQNEY